jgi:hypothetical protein
MIIIADTREKKPWNFGFFGMEQITKKVETGDYTVQGFEDKISVDRKQNVSELYQNLFKEYPRFKREMERMEGMEAYILCEFPYSHILTFPDTMPLVWCAKAKKKVPMKLRFTSQHIIDRVEAITKRHGVIFLYNDTRREAESQAFKILKEFYEKTQECD